jgi:hypothetical protein
VSASLLTPEVRSVLELQGIGLQTYVGCLGCSPDLLEKLRSIAGESKVVEMSDLESAAKAAKSSDHYVLVSSIGRVQALLSAIGADAASTIAVIAVGRPGSDEPSPAMLRSLGAMAVEEDPSPATLDGLLRRGFEFRALRALELAHRCEARRLKRRELNLLGHPPETMTDDLSTFQPPPLPVGPISTYNLEDSSEAFERAYIDRVQLLCESAREAAKYLDVSAATLARRLRREGTGNG